MSENLLLSLQITAIGMGLVFAAIVLLWGVIAALVRLTSASLTPVEKPDPAIEVTEQLQRQRAAAAAVAVAIQVKTEQTEPQEFPLPEAPIVTAWQAVRRTGILNRRGRRK